MISSVLLAFAITDAPARALYASAGFEVCEPFGEYVLSPYSLYMTLDLA